MQLRLVIAALAALSFVLAGSALAQEADKDKAPEPKPPPTQAPEPKNVVTPIDSFADAAGAWTGWVDYYTRVVMYVSHDGWVKFRGPRDFNKRAKIEDRRLVVDDTWADLDCGIMNQKLACHSRFGGMWAELSLTKVEAYPRRGW